MSEELTAALANMLRERVARRAAADFDEIRQLHRVTPITAGRGGSLQI